MDAPPKVQFTQIRGGWVAYQVLGAGNRDFVYVPGLIGNLDAFQASPPVARFFRNIAAYGRFVVLDRRGCGLSDRLPPEASLLEEWGYDPIGVMDAIGVERATLIAFDTGTPIAMYTAATYPDRVDGLILMEPFAVSPSAQQPEEVRISLAEMMMATWGEGNMFRMINPDLGPEWEEEFNADILGQLERASLHKGEVVANMIATTTVDVREALPSIRAPALLIASTNDAWVPFELAQEVHDGISGSTLVPLEGRNMHGWMFDPQVLPAIDAFVDADHKHTQAHARSPRSSSRTSSARRSERQPKAIGAGGRLSMRMTASSDHALPPMKVDS